MPQRTATRSLIVVAIPDSNISHKWTQAIQKKFSVHAATDRAGLEWSMNHLKPAILILDLSFPKLGRGSAVPTIQQLSPGTKTIILSKAPDEKEGVFMLKAGAKGYCKNDMDPALIKKVVAMVPKGEIWVERK